MQAFLPYFIMEQAQSYIAIANNTDYTYSIKVGSDKQALLIGTVVAGAITTAITAGAFAGVATGAIVTVGTGISIASGLASAGVALHDYLSNKGYVTLEPGETWTSDKMAISLWRQCECIRSRKEGNYMQLRG